jgi:hypothetical protein
MGVGVRGFLFMFAAVAAWAQDGAHWGVQGDGGYGVLPQFIVEEIHTLPEIPTIDGPMFQVGVVRFNNRGAPSFAFQYSQVSASIAGSISDPRGTASVTGDATVRGFMASKYLNFVTRERWSAGVALGGGVGKLDASYTRSVRSLTATIFSDMRSYEYTVPLFEILARVDFRVARNLTIGPFYGVRNGIVGGGGAVRVHFLK